MHSPALVSPSEKNNARNILTSTSAGVQSDAVYNTALARSPQLRQKPSQYEKNKAGVAIRRNPFDPLCAGRLEQVFAPEKDVALDSAEGHAA